MKCIVCVGADYPHTPPTFAIEIVEESCAKKVQEIQVKVNTLVLDAASLILFLHVEHRSGCQCAFPVVGKDK